MDEEIFLEKKDIKKLAKLSDMQIIRKIYNIYPGKGIVSTRELPLASPLVTGTSSLNDVLDFLCIKGKTKFGFDKTYKCLPFSNENLKMIIDFIANNV